MVLMQELETIHCFMEGYEDSITLPLWFSQTHGPFEEDQDVTLVDPSGYEFSMGITVEGNLPTIHYGVTWLRRIYNQYDRLLFHMVQRGNLVFSAWILDHQEQLLRSPDRPSEESITDEIEVKHSGEGDTSTYEWSIKMTNTLAYGRQPLPLPRTFVSSVLTENQVNIVLETDMGRRGCSLLWRTRSGRQVCALGRGWYAYVREKHIHRGNLLRFTSNGDRNELQVFVTQNHRASQYRSGFITTNLE